MLQNSKEAAKERLHLVLMQDRANVSADFLELMKQEIIEVIKKIHWCGWKCNWCKTYK